MLGGVLAEATAAVSACGGVVLGATSSAGRQKKAWGRCWEVVLAMGVA